MTEEANQESVQSEQVTQEAPQVESTVSLGSLVSEEYKSVVESKGFKDVNDVIKSYTNLERMVGKSIRIPSDDASPEAKKEFLDKLKGIDNVLVKPGEGEDVNDFYNKLGRPESPDNYKLLEGLGEDITPNEKFIDELNSFQELAHQMGLTKEQAKGLVGMRVAALKQEQESRTLMIEENKAQLQKLWGQDYDNRLNAAKEVAGLYAEKFPNEMQELIDGAAGSNPAFLNMLVELGKTFKEQGHAGMQTTKFGMSPDEARDKIAEKRLDTGFMKAYHDDTHPNHAKAVADMQKLYGIADGQG